MQPVKRKIETKHVQTVTTYVTDSFRKIKNDEGVFEVKRWVETRQVGAVLQVVDGGKGGIFHNGGRIA